MMDGEWLLGAQVPFEEHVRGRTKLLQMAAMVVDECLTKIAKEKNRDLPILLCLPDRRRVGRMDGLDESFLYDLYNMLGFRMPISVESMLFLDGSTGGVRAIMQASKLVFNTSHACIVVGLDTLLTKDTLQHYHDKRRLLTDKNADGFIPGEAAAAVVLDNPLSIPEDQLICRGLGISIEPAPLDSGKPLRADGMVEAMRMAMADAKCSFKDLHYRITDLNGEYYGFKEACLALTRNLRERKEDFDIWHPAECVGEVGAASVPLVMGVALYAAKKGFAPGPGVLCHFSNDGAERAAMVLQYRSR